MFKLVLALLFLLTSAVAQTSQSTDVQNGGDFSNNPDAAKLPTGVILVKGAVAASSDNETPLPESGAVKERVYSNRYFGLSYALPPDFVEKYEGPPPSDSGYYVLAELTPGPTFQGASSGSVLISAQDLFFSLKPIANAMQFIRATAANLSPDLYQVEHAPVEVKIAGRTFARLDYTSPVAGLHWYVLATQVRCHVLQFTFTSRDTALLNSLVQSMDNGKLTLPSEAGAQAGHGGGDAPLCMRNYASGDNVVQHVDPVFADRKFNPVPVRFVISKEGQVKHVHVISAFPDQADIVTESLQKWLFKPVLVNGQPVEIETGILFGASRQKTQAAQNAGVQ